MKNRSNFFYVYLHKRLDNDKIFYVGKGKGDRATTSKHRNEHWHNVVNKVGYRVVLLKEDLFEQEAFDLEISISFKAFMELRACISIRKPIKAFTKITTAMAMASI